MGLEQLELFQPENDYERSIFKKAKKLKQIAQTLYKETPFSEPVSSSNDYAVLQISVSIDQVQDDGAPEPSSPKMFIWKFIPEVSSEMGGERSYLLRPGDSLNSEIGPRIIPKWINELFTTNSFTHGDFLLLTKQYFSLDLAIKILESAEFAKLKGKVQDKELIIYFESKIFPHLPQPVESVQELEVLNKIGNFFTKLKNLMDKTWYLVGRYEDFTKENDLLRDLDESAAFNAKRDADPDLKDDVQSLEKIYQNDYLFLNNAELVHSKGNTDTWDTNFVLAPYAYNEAFTEFARKELKDRLLYFYSKKPAEKFFRTEVLLPGLNLEPGKLTELIKNVDSLVHEER